MANFIFKKRQPFFNISIIFAIFEERAKMHLVPKLGFMAIFIKIWGTLYKYLASLARSAPGVQKMQKSTTGAQTLPRSTPKVS